MVGWFGRLRRRNDRGAALVEAALVMPLLLVLTVGIWSTARAWNVHNVLDHAAREAARYGVTADELQTPQDLTGITNVWRDEVIAASIDPDDALQPVTACVALVPQDANCFVDSAAGNRVQVRLQKQHTLDFIFFSFDINFQAQAVSRYEPK